MSPSAHLRALCVSKLATSALTAATASCKAAAPMPVNHSFNCDATATRSCRWAVCPCCGCVVVWLSAVVDVVCMRWMDGWSTSRGVQPVLGRSQCHASPDASRRLHFGAWVLFCHVSDACFLSRDVSDPRSFRCSMCPMGYTDQTTSESLRRHAYNRSEIL